MTITVPLRTTATRRWLVALATSGTLLVGCGSGGAAPAAVDLDEYSAAELAPPSPELPYPCSLFGAADFDGLLEAPSLDDIGRDRVSNWATGCSWKGTGGTRIDFVNGVDAHTLDSILTNGVTMDDIGDRAASVEQESELDDGSAAIYRTTVAAAGPLSVSFRTLTADPEIDPVAALTRLTLARLAAATSPLDAAGNPQLGDDRRVCEEVVTSWARVYTALSGAAEPTGWSSVSASGKAASSLVEWAGRIAPDRTYPDLRRGFEALAAAAPADSYDPTAAQVTAVRDAVVAIGTACATGGVAIDWLPR